MLWQADPTGLTTGPMSCVAILLSTYNGQRFVAAQLESFRTQTHADWVLYWRDDGSTDDTPAIVRGFLAELPPARRVIADDRGRVGATESFLRLLRHAVRDGHTLFAFADQDDVWAAEKLARGANALAGTPPLVPSLYFARQTLVDAALRPLGVSPAIRRKPGFPAALAQNVATGCTLMLNRSAAERVAASIAPAATFHDWWCYLLVAGAEGRLIWDQTPVVQYRQHDGSLVGAPASLRRRAIRALHRGPWAFMETLRQHVAALIEQPELLAPSTQVQIGRIADTLRRGPVTRLHVLCMPGFRRQTWSETFLFRLWFVLG